MTNEQSLSDKKANAHHGKVLRGLRMHKGWSQRKLGDKANMSQPKICQLECEATIPENERKIFADIFEVPVEVFDKFSFDEAVRNINNSENTANTEGEATSLNGNNIDEISLKNNIADSQQITYEPLGKVSELYERIIGLEKKIALLEDENRRLRGE